jgi:aryl-alcohol dehydrogenase-like predicted oxidoreductase
MKYINLGFSGLKVSELCLGTMTFGEEFGIGAPETECRRIFDVFVEAGGNFIDTANFYNRGTSEIMLGEFIAGHREEIVLATKYSLNTRPDDPNAGGSHRKNLVQALEASLVRLGTDYIDLYWVHGWDQITPLAELMRALDDQVRAGKILHVGISNAPAWVIAAANTLAQERNLTPFTALQMHYNLIERGIEDEFPDLARAQNMGLTAWSPLAGGLLTGKFDADADPDKRRGARLSESPMAARVMRPENLAAAAKISSFAKECSLQPAQLAIAWLLRRQQPTTIPIIGARSEKQALENIGAVDLKLDREQIARLDELTAPPARYPGSLLSSDAFQTMMFGEQRPHIDMPPVRI